MKNYKFCPKCGSNLAIAKLNDNSQYTCKNCGWIYYSNPLPSAVAFVRNIDNQILLIKRGVEPGKGKWALPSGFIEYDELPEKAVLRELKEETSITGNINRLIGVYVEPTKVYGNVLLIAYELDYVKGKPKAGSDTTDARFFPVDKLPAIPFRGHKSIIKDAITQHPRKIGLIEVLKSKITQATVTRTVVFYKGSMGIDSKIMKAVNILPGEKVHVLNYNNGERLETYVIEEKADSGKFILYGPASIKGKTGDKLCILAYTFVAVEDARNIKPSVVILNKDNRIKHIHI